jgi:hypothetical protein
MLGMHVNIKYFNCNLNFSSRILEKSRLLRKYILKILQHKNVEYAPSW